MALGSVGRFRAITALTGVLSAGSGCATHSAQITHSATQTAHVIKAESFTRNSSHITQNLKFIEQSGMLSPEQMDSLLKVPSSNPDELVQATTDIVFAMKGCIRADAQCAENARPLCKEFEDKKFECPEYQTRCGGVLKACTDFINKYIFAVTDLLRSEAELGATEATKGAVTK